MSNVTDENRVIGRVKWFNHTRGYGFVTALNGDSEGKDVFVHHTSLSTKDNVYRSLTQGEYIEFFLVKDSENKDCANIVTGLFRNPLLCEVPKPNRGSHRDNKGNVYRGENNEDQE